MRVFSRALTLLAILSATSMADEPLSAFRFQESPGKVKSRIDLKEVKKGVPKADPRDAIPAIRKPESIPAEKASKWLAETDQVLGVTLGGEARAYPLKILETHEMVNDVLGGIPIAPNY